MLAGVVLAGVVLAGVVLAGVVLAGATCPYDLSKDRFTRAIMHLWRLSSVVQHVSAFSHFEKALKPSGVGRKAERVNSSTEQATDKASALLASSATAMLLLKLK